ALALPDSADAAKLSGYKTTGPLHSITGEQPSPKNVVTGYNNFYEFGTGKEDPAANAPSWKPDVEWPVVLEGEVKARKVISLDQIMKLAPLEERIYRL